MNPSTSSVVPKSSSPWTERMQMTPVMGHSQPYSPFSPKNNDDLEFNIASFNVLAESYLTPRSHPGLPASYAEVAFNPPRRRKLLVETLRRFCCPPEPSLIPTSTRKTSETIPTVHKKWDIICFQELDLIDPIVPALEMWGYTVVRTPNEQRVDCCAIAFDALKFSLVTQEVIKFDDLASLVEGAESFSEEAKDSLAAKSKKYPQPSQELSGMVRSFLRRNCAIVAQLEANVFPDDADEPPNNEKMRQRLIVASAHLYWHPGYEYVKLCQAKYLLDRIHAMACIATAPKQPTRNGDKSSADGVTNTIPVIVCGDMNSKPGSIVHRFFVQPHVDARRAAPWHFHYDSDEESVYQEEDFVEKKTLNDRRDGQDPIANSRSNIIAEGNSDRGAILSTADFTQEPDPLGQSDDSLTKQNNASIARVDKSKTGIEKEFSALNFGQFCGFVSSSDSAEGKQGRKIGPNSTVLKNYSNSASEHVQGLTPYFDTYPRNTFSSKTENQQIVGKKNKDIYESSGLDEASKINPENNVPLDPAKNQNFIKSAYPCNKNGSNESSDDSEGDELKATLASRRLNKHKSPQDYQHCTPPPPVKYMLDYTLNRFTRWLRILGVDASLETEEEEKQRTKNGKIALFDHCKNEQRTLITTSYKLLLRKECPPGAYLIEPRSTTRLEQALVRLLRTHGVELAPRVFLTRCVVCNGNIHRVFADEEKKSVFVEHGAPDLVGEDMEVFRCDGCRQGYWWDDRPSSSASRVFVQATKLFRLCLRGGVRVKDEEENDDKKREVMGAFDFVDVEKERKLSSNDDNNHTGNRSTASAGAEISAIKWLRDDRLANPLRNLTSAYAFPDSYATKSSSKGSSKQNRNLTGVSEPTKSKSSRLTTTGEELPFTNVTLDFVGMLDYIFYESSAFELIGRLNIPTSFREMNVHGIPRGHLIPSDIWPSDHLAVGARLRLKLSSDNKINKKQPKASTYQSGNSTEPSKMKVKTGNQIIPKVASGMARHAPRCDCGCVPQILSLFEMAELRKKAREAAKAKKG